MWNRSERRSLVRGLGAVQGVAAVAFIGARALAATPGGAGPCDRVAEADKTTIAFEPPSTFTICRHGTPQDDVVSGRPVFLELLPSRGTRMFDFRVHGARTEPPSGLATWARDAQHLAHSLHELSRSAQPISDISVHAASGGEQLGAARALYLGVVTPQFHSSLAAVHKSVSDLVSAAEALGQWCQDLRGAPVPPKEQRASRFVEQCAARPVQPAAVAASVHALLASAEDFGAKRDRARTALIMAEATPADARAQAAAIAALDEARSAADAVVANSRALAPVAIALAANAESMREVLHAPDILHQGAPVLLAHYAHGGNATLEIDVRPSGLPSASALSGGPDATQSDASTVSYRFAVIDPHYFDIEVGVGITAGLPQLPTPTPTQGGATMLTGRPVDEFVGLALVELEPARFLWPDKPLAGILRLPVLGVPLSRDPTQNFFIGAGLGWTGVGSLVAGPNIVRELSFRNGYGMNQSLPAGTSFDVAVHPAVQVGYFVSASVDLVGIFHLFVKPSTDSFDAASGKPL